MNAGSAINTPLLATPLQLGTKSMKKYMRQNLGKSIDILSLATHSPANSRMNEIIGKNISHSSQSIKFLSD